MGDQSIWKKEISLRRRKPPVRAGGPAEGVPAAPTAKPSFWKKEISFKRKPPAEPAPPAPAPAADTAVAATTPVDAPAAALSLPPDVTAALELIQTYAALKAAQPPAEAPTPAQQTEPPAPVEVASVAEPAVPHADPPAVQIPSPSEPAGPPVAPSTRVPAPAPVVVHPPVPAAELPPLPPEQPPAQQKEKENDDGRVPFYRRELSFGRKRKPAEASEKPEKRQKRVKEKSPARAARSLSLPRAQRRGGNAAKRLVGLKIGASQLSAATVANNGHAEVLQVARTPLDPGIVAGGELREPDALAAALKTFFAKHKLPKRGVRLGIATNRIGVRTLDIVGIDDPKQLANAIRFRAQEALPIPIDEAVLDYQVLSEWKNEEGETTRKILLVLAYRDLVDRYVAACRKAGLTLAGIDLEAFALLRALMAPREDETPATAAFVAVTIGHERTTFAVSDGRVCEFTRVLDWGGATLNVALARALEKAPSEVDEIKRALTLDGAEVPEGMTAEQTLVCRDALRRQVQAFARELVSSLQFYQNQPGSLGIGEIVITGGTAHLSGFAAELEKLIGVRVRVGDPLVRVRVGKRFKEPEQIGSLAVAIGLGIED